MILLDTCVLSEAFRKGSTAQSSRVDQLRQMIVDDWPLAVPGVVYQEFLTGFKTEKYFVRAKDVMSGFDVVLAEEDDHELAARIRSQCLRKGISATGIDSLIAATAINRNSRLLTFDRDFVDISRVCHLKLFEL